MNTERINMIVKRRIMMVRWGNDNQLIDCGELQINKPITNIQFNNIRTDFVIMFRAESIFPFIMTCNLFPENPKLRIHMILILPIVLYCH